MSCWFCIPSKRPPAEAQTCIDAWRDMGYNVAVCRERYDGALRVDMLLWVESYLGWAASTNKLVRDIMANSTHAQWFVAGGDDYWPDPNKRADEIAEECGEYFGMRPDLAWWGEDSISKRMHKRAMGWGYQDSTFGVMQPTGDPWSDSNGRIIERIAGSPWLGREWCRRAYGGDGPLPPYYKHNFADEELQLVAQNLGVFWQRPDLVQEHRHWGRPGKPGGYRPSWWNTQCGSDFGVARELFEQRKAAGFPGHELLH